MSISRSAATAFRSPDDATNGSAALASLFQPLDRLLVSGGDARLTLSVPERVNRYGCAPAPRVKVLSFSSSTATTISERAYARANMAREGLLAAAATEQFESVFEARIEGLRQELKSHLGLEHSGAAVVFSPSGTDSQLHALFITKALLRAPLTTIVVASDQTGSGTVHTTRGEHFSAQTPQGETVEKGAPIAGLADGVQNVNLPLIDGQGALVSANEMDRLVIAAVEAAARAGKVLVQIMDSSKLGLRSPSEACLREICERWPDAVQIVVDACQLRLGRPRLADYLSRGFLVLITGSKFFAGPPFSGALLVPEQHARRMARLSAAPTGLKDYAGRADWPADWPLRDSFRPEPSAGPWLRWEAALEEMRAYFAPPSSFRRTALMHFGASVASAIQASPSLALMPVHNSSDARDEEMALTTIFPFLLRRAGALLTPEACSELYRDLNRDISPAYPGADPADRAILATPCLIGQPVALAENGMATAALRLSASARIVSENWSPDPNVAHQNMRREREHVATVLRKTEFLLTRGQP